MMGHTETIHFPSRNSAYSPIAHSRLLGYLYYTRLRTLSRGTGGMWDLNPHPRSQAAEVKPERERTSHTACLDYIRRTNMR